MKVKKTTMITMTTNQAQRMAMAESDLELCKMYTGHLEKQINEYKKEVKALGKMTIKMGKDIEKLSKMNRGSYSPKFSPKKNSSKTRKKSP